MPKSNFNQFLDECEDYKTVENNKISKISFETKHPDCEYDQTVSSNSNTSSFSSNAFSSNNASSSSNASNASNAFSSNIFLSKNANSANRQGQNRFNHSSHVDVNVRNARRENNIFKKTDTSQSTVQKYGGNGGNGGNGSASLLTSLTSSTPSNMIEINNETFPSLGSTSTVSGGTSNAEAPKKFKNFKDAICASASAVEPVLSPTKQKQLKAIKKQSSVAHPLAVKAEKKDSEMYAKKILAKTNNFAYDDDEDDGGDHHVNDYYNEEESLYKSQYKQNFIKRRCNDGDYSGDD